MNNVQCHGTDQRRWWVCIQTGSGTDDPMVPSEPLGVEPAQYCGDDSGLHFCFTQCQSGGKNRGINPRHLLPSPSSTTQCLLWTLSGFWEPQMDFARRCCPVDAAAGPFSWYYWLLCWWGMILWENFESMKTLVLYLTHNYHMYSFALSKNFYRKVTPYLKQCHGFNRPRKPLMLCILSEKALMHPHIY